MTDPTPARAAGPHSFVPLAFERRPADASLACGRAFLAAMSLGALLGRPPHERAMLAMLVMPVGDPAPGATAPDLARKPLHGIAARTE